MRPEINRAPLQISSVPHNLRKSLDLDQAEMSTEYPVKSVRERSTVCNTDGHHSGGEITKEIIGKSRYLFLLKEEEPSFAAVISHIYLQSNR